MTSEKSPVVQAGKPIRAGSVDQVISAFAGSRITLFNQDAELRYRWLENPPEGFPVEDLIGRTDYEILPKPASAMATEQKRQALESGERRKFELPVLVDGSTRYFEIIVHPEFDSKGRVTGLTGSAVDISRERRQAQSMANLILEVSHRSRNLLAIVQSIATQTAASETSIEVYRDFFLGRLHCLSRTQDIVTARDWQGAAFGELVDAQMEGVGIADQLTVDCADLFLTPSAALHIGLALHELARNASAMPGDQEINLSVTMTGDKKMPAQLHWDNSRSPKATAKPFGSFARSILERVVPQSLDGVAELRETEGRTLYRVQIGASSLYERGF